MLESNSLTQKFPGGASERKVRKIHCSVVGDVRDDEIKPHHVGTYLLDYCTLNHGEIQFQSIPYITEIF